MPATLGIERSLTFDDLGNIIVRLYNIELGVYGTRELATDERLLVNTSGTEVANEIMADQDDVLNHPERTVLSEEEEEEQEALPEVLRRYSNPLRVSTAAPEPARPAARPRRTRAERLPVDERSRRIANTLPLYIEAVKKRIQLWKLMEEISVALEQSLARVNRFDLEDSQIDGVAAGFDDEVCADGLSMEEMCDALRIEYPCLQ